MGLAGLPPTLSGDATPENVRDPRLTGETGTPPNRDRIHPVNEYSYVKGHGTENDFVLVPDANGRFELTAGPGGAAVRPPGGDRR